MVEHADLGSIPANIKSLLNLYWDWYKFYIKNLWLTQYIVQNNDQFQLIGWKAMNTKNSIKKLLHQV